MRTVYGLGSRLLEKMHQWRYRMRMRDLVARGLVLGKNVTIEYTAYIDSGFPCLIRIGDNCSIANHVRVLAHDAATFKFTNGYTRLGKVVLHENCFIGERSIILPGVTIGPNVVVAAGSVVKGDIPADSCAAGVPAEVYARFTDWIEQHRQRIQKSPLFESSELYADAQTRTSIWESVQDGSAYVRGSAGRYPYTSNSE